MNKCASAEQMKRERERERERGRERRSYERYALLCSIRDLINPLVADALSYIMPLVFVPLLIIMIINLFITTYTTGSLLGFTCCFFFIYFTYRLHWSRRSKHVANIF